MTSRSGEYFDRGLDFFAAMAGRLRADDWERATPCAGWNARDVLGHLASTVGVATSVMRGTKPAWPEVARPGDLVVGEPVEFWRGTAARAREVLRDADLEREMETPLGRTAGDDISIPVIDLYVHTWDLGAAVGTVIEIPDEVIAYAHDYVDPLPEDVVRGDDRAFALPAGAPAGATPTERFVAWTGRDPARWFPEADRPRA